MKKFYDDKLIILTGGAGFLGSCTLKYLNDLGITSVIIVDNLDSTDKWKNLVGKKFVDIIDINDVFSWLHGRESEIRAFIHLGACSNTLSRDADYLLKNNYRFSVRLAEYALTNEHRFIYASTAGTYGNGEHGFSDDHYNLKNLQPLSMYAYSKHLFDLWIKNQGVLNLVVGLKYFNLFGPNESHKGNMASVIPQLINQALQEETIRLFKSTEPGKFDDGEQKRDFLYIKDAVKMTCGFLFNSMGGIFNIGSGKAISWNQFARYMVEALDKDISIEYVAMPDELIDQYQSYTCSDMSKYFSYASKAELDTSITDVKKAVKEYVKEYLLKDKRW